MMENVKILLAVTLLSLFIIGCARTHNLGLIEPGRNSSMEEYYVDDYKIRIRIIPAAGDYEYICSFSLLNKDDRASIKDIKSVMDVKMYSSYPRTHYKHRHEKKTIFSDLEPIADSASNDYDYKYKLKGKGKYEMILTLTEIEGRKLEEDIRISFIQEVK